VIDLYTWGTPNGRKISVMLEEVDLPYQVFPINITKGEQHDPDFLKISPNNKIPAIVDSDGPGGEPISLFESGAILIYLAEKTGKFYPTDARARYAVLEWLMFQMGGVGPMFGQAHHFRRFAPEQIPYAVDRYTNETKRLYGVMDKRLADHAYLAGDDYTIADIATFPWAARHEWQGVDLADFPNLKRWYDAIWDRPAVKKGFEVP
jgi:GST-like protein